MRTPPVAQQVLREGASRAALSSRAASTHRQKLLIDQASLKTSLEQRKIAVTGSVQTLLNAVFVMAPPSRRDELQAIPGVAGVVRLAAIRRKLNTALDLVGAGAAWASAGGPGNAGAGIKIAILDSGIDETHPGFQDLSLSTPSGFPKAANPDDARHATNKVIAVRSFVAALADGDGTAAFSRPGGTARPGGPWHRGRHDRRGSVAPKPARDYLRGGAEGMAGELQNIRWPGVNDTTTADVALQALESAFNDGMDVALLSAGSIPAIWSPTTRVQSAVCPPVLLAIPGWPLWPLPPGAT